MPRTKKPAGQAIDRRNGRRADLEAPTVLAVDLPRPREAYTPLALATWDGFWSTPVAATVTEADLMVVQVWIEAYDDALRKRAEADLQPITKGSMGQQIANPLYAVAQAQMTLAMQCARQLGVGARNRADLGVSLFGAQAVQRGATLPTDVEDDDDDGDDDDPRVIRGDLA